MGLRRLINDNRFSRYVNNSRAGQIVEDMFPEIKPFNPGFRADMGTGLTLLGLGTAAVVLPGCSTKDNDPAPQLPPAPVEPEYIDPISSLAGLTNPPYREADFLNHVPISKSDWETYYEPLIGVLPDVNNKATVWAAFNNLRTNITTANNIEKILDYTPNIRDNAPDTLSNGGIWIRAKLTQPVQPFTNNNFWALFTSANSSLDTITQNMIKEFFGSSITERDYSGVPYTALEMAINITGDLFSKFGVKENRTEFQNYHSGDIVVKNPIIDAIDPNGVLFHADAYVTWQDANSNDHSLIVRINNGAGLDPLEQEAITKMEAARQNGTYFYHDVLYIDLSNPSTVIPNFRPGDWDSTSEGAIRYAILDAIARADAGPQTSGSSSTKFSKAVSAYSNPRVPTVKTSYTPGVEDKLILEGSAEALASGKYTTFDMFDKVKYSLRNRTLN